MIVLHLKMDILGCNDQMGVFLNENDEFEPKMDDFCPKMTIFMLKIALFR